MSDPHRDPDGRFQNGGKDGPGRPRRAIESDYLAKLSEAVPLSVWQEIVAKAVEDAREGDHAARPWLAGYLCGKPTGDALRNLAVDEEVGVDPLAVKISEKELMARVSMARESDRPIGPGPWERPSGPRPGRSRRAGRSRIDCTRHRPATSYAIVDDSGQVELYRPGSKPSARVTASQGGNFKNLAIKTGIALIRSTQQGK